MKIKNIHYFSGLLLIVFIGLHQFNHLLIWIGKDTHLQGMDWLRIVYRNPFVESILFLALFAQIISGVMLIRKGQTEGSLFFRQLQKWTGLYLLFFLILHTSAVMAGRFALHLDTNLYFGIAGLNTYPYYFFFIPYYGLAIISFFGHMAAIHSKKMTYNLFAMSPSAQAKGILVFGVIFAFCLIAGLTNAFKGFEIPSEYGILIGK